MNGTWLDVALTGAGSLSMLVGGLFVMIGGLGVIRLPDFYARLHGAGITDTLGAGLILIGLMFHAGLSLAMIKLLMILFFLFVTSPTACHALAQAARVHDVEPYQPEQRAEGE